MLGASCLVSCCPPCFVVIARRVCGGGVGAPSQSRPHILDNGKEFKASFVPTCADRQVRHTRTKPRHAWTNGFVERLQGTILHEHWRLEFRRHYFRSARALQRSVDRLPGFNNPKGLFKLGANLYGESGAAGLPNIGAAGTGGKGSLIGSALETSNVDLAERGHQDDPRTARLPGELADHHGVRRAACRDVEPQAIVVRLSGVNNRHRLER